MTGIVTHSNRVVTHDGQPVHYELAAAIAAAGPAPPERIISVAAEERKFNVAEEIPALLKDPGALLPYELDWTPWLAGAEIETSEWTAPEGMIAAHTHTETDSTVWLEGGTPHTTIRVTNKISTSDNRVDSRSILVRITER